MALFLDVHERLPEGASVEDVAGARQADLAVQERYRVKYLKWWFDEEAGKVFCLAEAASADTLVAVHREAHGLLADRIYEVIEGE